LIEEYSLLNGGVSLHLLIRLTTNPLVLKARDE